MPAELTVVTACRRALTVSTDVAGAVWLHQAQLCTPCIVSHKVDLQKVAVTSQFYVAGKLMTY